MSDYTHHAVVRPTRWGWEWAVLGRCDGGIGTTTGERWALTRRFAERRARRALRYLERIHNPPPWQDIA